MYTTLTSLSLSLFIFLQSQSMAPKIEEQRGTAKSLADQLYRLQRSPSYLHALVSLLESIREFQQTCGVSICSYTFTCISISDCNGLWPNFGTTLKIYKKSNFDRNQFKLSTQHKNMYMHQKKI